MVRWLVVVPAFAACATSNTATLELGVDDGGTLHVELASAPGHTFGALSATANGIDLGAPSISRTSATFSIAMAQLGRDVDVEVIDGYSHFAIDAPGLGAARVPIVSLSPPLHAGDWIDAGDGLPGDEFTGDFALVQGAQTCTVEWTTKVDGSVIEMQLSSDLARDWWCTPVPAAGAQATAHLVVDLSPSALATSCSGDDLVCAPISLPALHYENDVVVQF